MENKGNRRLTHTKNICLLYRLNGCECVGGLGGRLLIMGGCNGVKLSSAGGGWWVTFLRRTHELSIKHASQAEWRRCALSHYAHNKSWGKKKTGPVENWNRNRKKKTKTKGGPKNLFSAACTLLIRQALRFTIYLRAKSNYCMCHNFHSTLGVTKSPK